MKNKKDSQHFSDLEALQFHSKGKPGKIEIRATKPLDTHEILVWHIVQALQLL